MQVTAQHRDDLCCILEGIYADEVQVIATGDVRDGLSLDLQWPFKVPPDEAKMQ